MLFHLSHSSTVKKEFNGKVRLKVISSVTITIHFCIKHSGTTCDSGPLGVQYHFTKRLSDYIWYQHNLLVYMPWHLGHLLFETYCAAVVSPMTKFWGWELALLLSDTMIRKNFHIGIDWLNCWYWKNLCPMCTIWWTLKWVNTK